MALFELVAVSLLGAFLVQRLRRTVQNKKRHCTAPGPRGLPIIGNVLQIDATVMHKSLTELALQYGEVYQFSMMGDNFVVISSLTAAHEAMVKRGLKFADRPHMFRTEATGMTRNIIFRY